MSKRTRELEKKPCLTCGKVFEEKPHEGTVRFSQRRYCCKACVQNEKPKKTDDQIRGRYRSVLRNGKRLLLHRHIMEEHLGRKLRTDEHVHHKNGDRLDNRIENLEVMSAAEHISQHKSTMPVNSVCWVCEKIFAPGPGRRGKTKTCSMECANIQRIRTRRITLSCYATDEELSNQHEY